MLSTIFLGCFVCLCAYLVNVFIKQSKLPPGPYGLPVVGYLPFLGNDHHLTLSGIAKTYGNVFCLRLGLQNVVFLNDWASIKDGFSNPLLLGRPEIMFGSVRSNLPGHVALDGPKWKEQRRMCQKIMHELGFSGQVMEANIRDELKYFCGEIDKKIGQPYDVGQLLSASISNNVAYFLFGKRFHYDDPVRLKLNGAFATFSQRNKFLSPKNFFKGFIKPLVWIKAPAVKEALECISFVLKLASEEIRQHRETLDSGHIRDFVDGCLLEMKKGANISDANIMANIIDFFAAGTDTTTVTIRWLLLLTVANPEIQKQVEEEIDNVIGSDRAPNYSDRVLMPWTRAVIAETQRWATTVPINLPRRAMKDTTVCGHFIPKDTTVFANLYGAHRDETMWEKPDSFDPKRFLSADGKEVKKLDALIPFSIGKRSCTGETLASYEIFFYYTTILQKYKVSIPEGTRVSLKGDLGISLAPQQASVFVFTKRDARL